MPTVYLEWLRISDVDVDDMHVDVDVLTYS
jgi:hypothetical protein